MKFFINLLILSCALPAFGQSATTTTLKVITGSCRSKNMATFPGTESIFFYKLPEDTLVFKITPKVYQSEIELDNVPVSTYRLRYENNYRQAVDRQVTLTNQDTNTITLCPDILESYPQNTLSKLVDQDSILINFHSSGCFHDLFSKIVIKKEANEFKALLYNVSSDYINKKRKKKAEIKVDSLLKTVTLSDKNIQDFIRFENEVIYMRDARCTTTDSYDIKSRYLNLNVVDGTCNWRGFYWLKKSFFGDGN